MPVPTKPSANGETPGPQPPKPLQKTTKAERRELQEKQRAAKQAKQTAASTSSSTPKASTAPSSPAPRKAVAKSGDITTKPQTPKLSKETKDIVSIPADDRETKSRGLRIFSHFGLPKQVTSTMKGNIHPSIIRLGLQFSEFKISGANARCIATLTAFKTVCSIAMFLVVVS
jgi:translation initiation factor eIF-2B subunit delta